LSKYVVKVEVKEAFRDWATNSGADDDTVRSQHISQAPPLEYVTPSLAFRLPPPLPQVPTDDYPDKWWHVRQCEVVDVVDSTTPPAWVTEELIFYWRPVNYVFNWMQLGWFAAFGA
jgi:hypothetical protein